MKKKKKTRCFTFHRALIFLFLRSACWRVFPIPNIPYHQQKGSTFIFYVLSYIDEPNTSCRRLEKNWVHRYFNKRARSSTSGFIICPRELLYRKTRQITTQRILKLHTTLSKLFLSLYYTLYFLYSLNSEYTSK